MKYEWLGTTALCATLVVSVLSEQSISSSEAESLNANHIFNSIHASMRQWGSSIHHNGMSFFLATVPKGTMLYHGSPHSTPVEGLEFLAFEPEHAMVFARPARRQGRSDQQEFLSQLNSDDAQPEQKGGWLHTYVTMRDLNLLYIDGMSAGKSKIGTLDSQDIILLEGTIDGGVSQEYNRAEGICNMSQERWGGRIDGAIRTAAGFEVILCSFARELKPVRITRTSAGGDGRGKGAKPATLLSAITSRYFDIGGDRVKVNYDTFVTAYSHDLDLFANGDLPRVRHIPSDQLDPIRREIHTLAVNHTASEGTINWQSITDLIVERYARNLRYLALGNAQSFEALRAELIALMNPFIDYDNRDEDAELRRCAEQFLPFFADTSSTAFQAVHTVSSRICSTIQRAISDDDYIVTTNRLQGLMRYLDWTTWRECLGCKDHTFCAVAIWPSGSKRDHEHPHCQDLSAAWEDGSGYWGPVWQ